MHTPETDEAVEGLPDGLLRPRLARTDWERDPEYISDEQVFRLFRRARRAGDARRVGMLSDALSRRLLARAKGFVLKNSIYPGLIGDIKTASHELASEFWDHLLSRPKDAAYAEKRLGKLFELRGIDFQRRLLSKKRKLQESLDAMDHSPDDDDPERTVKTIGALRQDATPEITVENRQRFEHVHGRLQAILTQNEYSTYTMLKVEGMAVKDIAKALDVTVRSVNNYKNAALAKIEKEFKQ